MVGGYTHGPRATASPARRGSLRILDRLVARRTSPTGPAVGLPFGTLKRIELARALAARPRLLMLDEPAAGLTHAEVDELGELMRDPRRVRAHACCSSSTTWRW